MNNQNHAEDESPSSQTFALPNRARQQVTIPGSPPKRPEQSFSFDDAPPPPPPPATARPIPVVTTGYVAPANKVETEVEAPAPMMKPAAERSANYISVELPSGFHFYKFKEISIGSVVIFTQAKFARAAQEQSSRITCEAVSSLIGDGISAMDLTIPDFYWLMYYLRLNNYSKNQMSHRAVCQDKEHLRLVREGVKPQETLVTVDIVKKSMIKETQLDLERLNKFMAEADLSAFTAGGYELSAPTMRDVLEMQDKYVDREDFGEMEYVADLASCIRRIDGTRATLDERVQFIGGQLGPDDNDTLEKFREIVQDYGVEEKIATRCKDCNAVVETELSITAFDFL